MRENKKDLLTNSKSGGGITKLNSNAFTLIELLAIIVILAIIAVITVPIILNIIDNSKKGAATDSAYGYKDAVNKYYVTELSKSENQNLILSGQYDVSTGGVLNGSGISNKEIPVSGDKPSAGELHYTNNTLQGGCLVIGDYQVIFDGGSVSNTTKGDCSDYEFDAGTLKIGDSINYSTTLNGVTLNNWKVFYIDGDYTYLIYGDYLPREAIGTFNSLTIGDDGIEDYETRSSFINILTTTSNWSSLLTGTLNGKTIDYVSSTDTNIYASGSPTLELWINSWNSNRGYKAIFLFSYEENYCDEEVIEYSFGYINDSEQSSDYLDLSSEKGFDNKLYFPLNDIGYYLASASIADCGYMAIVNETGSLGSTSGGYSLALRPVIKIPTSDVNQ